MMTNTPDIIDKDRLIEEMKAEVLRLQIENTQLRRELGNLTFRGVSEQIKTENECKQSQKLLLQVFNHTPLPIIVLRNKDYTVIEANDTFLKRSGLTRNQLKQGGPPDFCDWEDPSEFGRFAEMLRQDGMVKNYAMKNRLFSGELRHLILSAVMIEWRGEECMLVIGNDITELKKYENEILRVGYLSLVSQVAAGICQGIKNPLSTVRQFLQLFESKEKYKADMKAYELVIEELDRAEDIISTFSLLACKKDEIMKLQSLNDNIVQVFPLIMQEAEKNKVFIKLELSEAAPIMMDESEIRQLLHNLVRNGMEAMQNGGILTVGTFQDKNGVNLVVKDKGTGIPEDVMEKIATPFFTTKERRIGLGLSVCYSIVDRHNAQIDIKSSPEGTCVNVVFPAAAKAANSQTGKSAPA